MSWTRAHFRFTNVKIKYEKPGQFAFIEVSHPSDKGSFDISVFDAYNTLVEFKDDINAGKQFDLICKINKRKNKEKNPATGNWDLEVWMPGFVLEEMTLCGTQVVKKSMFAAKPKPTIQTDIEITPMPKPTGNPFAKAKPNNMFAKKKTGSPFGKPKANPFAKPVTTNRFPSGVKAKEDAHPFTGVPITFEVDKKKDLQNGDGIDYDDIPWETDL